jgi:hypothetical protein
MIDCFCVLVGDGVKRQLDLSFVNVRLERNTGESRGS